VGGVGAFEQGIHPVTRGVTEPNDLLFDGTGGNRALDSSQARRAGIAGTVGDPIRAPRFCHERVDYRVRARHDYILLPAMTAING
jgi:hypothetical protein